jgi:CheY-like chemotaxis protein
MDDELVFVDEEPADQDPSAAGPPWVVLVVDDDQMVLEVTALVLEDFVFKGRRLQLVNCVSAAEAAEVLARRDDVAAILLDVVMETDTAGLDLVRYIRGPMSNQKVRIVLRTGQPGPIPEHDIIRAYEINDYWQKTDLTAKYLIAALIFALRDYDDIVATAALKHAPGHTESLRALSGGA